MRKNPKSAVHESLDRTHKISGSSDRSFGLVFTAVFAAIGLWPLLDGLDPRTWALTVAGGFLLASLVRPSVLAPLNALWLRLGLLLNQVVSPIVMGLMFFVVFTPAGILMRLAGRDPLRLKLEPAASTYWIARTPPGPKADTMPQQF